MISESLLGPAAALGASLTWALGVAFYSALGERHAPATINFTRAAFSFPLFLIWAFVSQGSWSATIDAFAAIGGARVAWFFLSMLASFAFGDALFLWSSQSLGAAGALAISSVYPVWSALVGWVLHGERLSLTSGGGFILVLLGTVLVILSPARRVSSRADTHPQSGVARVSAPSWALGKLPGVACALGASIMWATNAWTVSHAGAGLAVPIANSTRMLIGALLCPLVGLVMSPGSRLALPWWEMRKLLWVFFLEAFLGTVFYFYGLSHTKLAVGAVLSSIAPVVVVPVALLMGRETFSWKRTLGTVGVFLGICLLLN